MRFAFGLTLTFSSGHALAHDGPLFSMAHADFWGMWLIALAILLIVSHSNCRACKNSPATAFKQGRAGPQGVGIRVLECSGGSEYQQCLN